MKISIYLAILLVSLVAVSAAEVCIVAQLDDTKVKGDCVNVATNTDGYNTLEESDLRFTWSDPGSFGRALCKIEGKGDNVAGTACQWGSEYWGFYIINNNEWSYMPVGFDSPGGCWNRDLNSFGGHYCAKDDDVLGFRYGEFGSLPDMLHIDEIKIYVNEKKSKADEDGGKIRDVEPDSLIEMKIKLENLYPDDVDIAIEEVVAELIIEDIDDGDELDEDTDEIDIEADETEELTLEFDIPLEVEEDDYNAFLTIEAEDEAGKKYEKTIEYTLEIEKDKHNLKFLEVEIFPETITCQSTATIDISLVNIGTEEEEVTLSIINQELDINIKDEFELEDDPFDDESKFRQRYTLLVNNAKNKEYPITVKADYEKEKQEEKVILKIAGCETLEKPVKEKVIVKKEPPKQQEQLSTTANAPKTSTIIALEAVLFVILLAIVIAFIVMLRQ